MKKKAAKTIREYSAYAAALNPEKSDKMLKLHKKLYYEQTPENRHKMLLLMKSEMENPKKDNNSKG